MCSVTSPPRISFSDDLGRDNDDGVDDQEERELLLLQIDDQKPRRDSSLLDSGSEFEFSICRSCLEEEPSLADDLFADGMILPARIHDPSGPVPASSSSTPGWNQVSRFNLYKARPGGSSLPLLPPLPTNGSSNPTRDQKVVVVVNCDQLVEEKQQLAGAPQASSSSKSFWGFKRSNSLNCDVRKSLIWSLPLLSRSNSTGSVSSLKDSHRRGGSSLNRQQSDPNGKPSSYSSLNPSYVYSLPQQKPPLKKSYGGAQGNNGVWISPVLNVPPPPPYISKGASRLLGFGSFLRGAKEKKSSRN